MNYIPIPEEEDKGGPIGIKEPIARHEKLSRIFRKSYKHEIDDKDVEDND